MSMSTSIQGFKPADSKWLAMKKVWDACEKAGVEAPNEVQQFFEYCDPDPAGVEVDISAAVVKLGEVDGFEVDVRKLPKDVTIIRFSNSW